MLVFDKLWEWIKKVCEVGGVGFYEVVMFLVGVGYVNVKEGLKRFG